MKRTSRIVLLITTVMLLLLMSASAVFAADSGSVGECTWTLSDEGVLTIKGPGKLPDANLRENPSSQEKIDVWPWHRSAADIKTVKIDSTGGAVVAQAQLRHMFSDLPNLEEVDLTGMDASGAAIANDMFKITDPEVTTTKLKKVIFSNDFAPQQLYRTFRNCSELTTIQFGTEESPYNPELASGRTYNKSAFNESNMVSVLAGCSKLTTLRFPGADLSTSNSDWTNRINNFVNAFNSANSLPKIMEMPDSTINAWLVARLFRKSTLQELYLQGAEIRRNYLLEMFHTSAGVCESPMLKLVDMTGAIFPGENEGDKPNGYGLFRNMTALETVILTNADFVNTQKFQQMFQDSTKLTTVLMNSVDDASTETVEERLDIDEAVNMFNMFKGCTALKELDLSGFGKLDHIVTVQDMFRNCTALEILNISNMDNSRIKPVNGNHPAWKEDTGAAECSSDTNKLDWGRNMAIDTCTALKWLIADNSKVWMTTNTKGNPDDQYFNAATELDGDGEETRFYYFTEKQMDLYKQKPENLDDPGEQNEKIVTRRDYIDVMTDRTTLPDGSEGPDYDTNVNTEHGEGHINTNGAGFLAPVTYHLLTETWNKDIDLPYQTTFYYIDEALLKESTPTVSLNNDRLNDGGRTITTDPMSHVDWKSNPVIVNSDGTPLITLTYPEAVRDVNGKVHDLVVKINKITYTNLTSIDKDNADPWPDRKHDGNVYVDDASAYYRDVLSYAKGMLQLKNYARAADGDHKGKSIIKGDAGADVDFSIEVKDAIPNTSVLFYIDDLDIPAEQAYEYPDKTDACYDNLPWARTEAKPTENPPVVAKGVTYEDHSEGIILREGNDIDTLKYTSHNGLAEDEKTVGSEKYTYIHGTGTDPSNSTDTKRGSTGWSAFSVKSDASKSNYTWTNGIGCTTDLLNPTNGKSLPDVKINPELYKLVNNATPSGDYATAFKFDLIAATEVTKVEYKGDELDNLAFTSDDKNTSETVSNNVRDVKLGAMSYSLPGTDSDTNEYKTNAYVYRIQEQVPNEPGDVISYNTRHVTYFMKVIVSNPESDVEMEKGVKAEITIGRYYSDATDEEWEEEWDDPVDPDKIIWDSWSETIWSIDMDEKGARWQEDRKVPFPATSTAEEDQYTVFKDRDNVEYIAVPAKKYYDDPSKQRTVYLDSNNPYSGTPSILVETVEGDVYPYEEQTDPDWLADNHPDKILSTLLKVDGIQVREDVHSQLYIKDENDYYAVTRTGDKYSRGDKLTVKDGTFNPDDDYDREVETVWMIDGSQVRVDSLGQKYYKASSGEYKDPDTGITLTVGMIGKVLPDSDDKPVTHDKTAGAILVVTDPQGIGQTVYETGTHKHYYKKGDRYYSVMHTMLTPGVDGFDPNYPVDPENPKAGEDNKYETDFDIMVDVRNDGTTVYYYRSDRDEDGEPEYYQYNPDDPAKNGKPYKPENPGDVDHTIFEIGGFNNKVRKGNITIRKQSVDQDGNPTTNKDGVFDYIIKFKNSAGDPTDFDFDKYQFTPASSTTFERLDTGVYKFKLNAGQEVVIYDVPFLTTYTISEPISDSEGEYGEMNLNGWEFVDIQSYKDYEEPDPGDPEPDPELDDPSYEREVTKKIVTDTDDLFYTHTFSNRHTELLLSKLVTKGDKQKEFGFDIAFSFVSETIKAGDLICFGYMDEDQNHHFETVKATSDGRGSGILNYNLSSGKDITIVLPFGQEDKDGKHCAVGISEVKGDYDTSVSSDGKAPIETSFVYGNLTKVKHTAEFFNEKNEAKLIKKWDDDSNAKGFRPDSLNGYIEYEDSKGDTTKVTTDEYTAAHPGADWDKDGNTWTYSFRLPKGATLTAGGEENVPKGYTHDSSKDELKTDVDPATYTMTNKLKPTEETETLKRTIKYIYEDTKEPVLDDKGKPITVEQELKFKREVTGWTDEGDPIWGPWEPSEGKMPAADSPKADRSGFTPKEKTVPATGTLTGDDKDKKDEKYPDVVVYYEKGPKGGEKETYGLPEEPQKGTPKFTPGSSPITGYSLVDPKTGKTTDKVVVPGEGTYTVDEKTGEVTFVPEKGFAGKGKGVKVRATDKNGKTADGEYTPNVVDPTDEDKASRTVHFTYLKKNGKKVTSNVKQTVKLIRKAEAVDPETGKVTKWGPWGSATFPAVKNPDKEAGKGWYTDDSVPELTVDKPGAVPEEYVIYHKVEYTVTYRDGDHGTSNGGKKNKKYGDTPQNNNVKAKKGYKFTGVYSYVITDLDGNVIKTGTTRDPKSVKVIGNIVFTPKYSKVSSGPDKDNDIADVRTGDTNNIALYIGLFAAAIAAVIAAIVIKRKKDGNK